MLPILKTDRFLCAREVAFDRLLSSCLPRQRVRPRKVAGSVNYRTRLFSRPFRKTSLLRIVRAEDERRWDDDLRSLFSARSDIVRARAALAAGRIGNEAAVADLIPLLQKDDEPEVRAMAAFALGEIESPLAADALVADLKYRPDLCGARAGSSKRWVRLRQPCQKNRRRGRRSWRPSYWKPWPSKTAGGPLLMN